MQSEINNKWWLLLMMICAVNICEAQEKAAARYEVDAKRVGVNPLDKEALPRSREFIRLDSTYYVGYMYEGLYKADKSSDALGYRNAIAPLRKSLALFDKDFGRNMRILFTAPEIYMQNVNKYVDYLQIANSLRECYDNLEMADSVMWVLNKVENYKFPKEHLAVTTYKAWTIHRNRFYTSAKYDFLGNSVEENEKKAFGYCFASLTKVNRNKTQNDMWFGPGQDEQDRQSVYHYLSLLHCYNKQYDSSEYYYQKLMEGGSISWNNYANLQHELGGFALANEYFNKDKYKYFQKMLREPYYFIPVMDVYAGRTKQAISTSKEAIDFAGSTPGFGWYNIALGRSYLYDGQLDSAEYVLDKAAAFKEIHIGTTLTQSQYDFTINLLKLQLTEKKAALLKFANKGWWYSPTALYGLVSLKIEKILLEYVLINQLSVNPERNRIVYDLFCSESTTTFDEATYLIKDFSPGYFIKKYEQYQRTDPRANVQRYFRLITHQIQWNNGDEADALKGYQELAQNPQSDKANEKLFGARLSEGLCLAYGDKKDKANYSIYSNALYEQYPQLIPFGDVKMKMVLTTSGVDDENIQKVISDVKRCHVEWVTEADPNTATANIAFVKRGDKYEGNINVKSGSGTAIVSNQKIVFKSTAGVGQEVSLRMFGKGGGLVYEQVEGD